MQKEYFEVVPISENPEKTGFYFVQYQSGHHATLYFGGTSWESEYSQVQHSISHWLRPVEIDPTDKWQPLDTMPKDRTRIIRWHIYHQCPMTVFYMPGLSEYPNCVWVSGEKSNTWPEEAFEPFWQPLISPPPKL